MECCRKLKQIHATQGRTVNKDLLRSFIVFQNFADIFGVFWRLSWPFGDILQYFITIWGLSGNLQTCWSFSVSFVTTFRVFWTLLISFEIPEILEHSVSKLVTTINPCSLNDARKIEGTVSGNFYCSSRCNFIQIESAEAFYRPYGCRYYSGRWLMEFHGT